jgi:hypothetical protein
MRVIRERHSSGDSPAVKRLVLVIAALAALGFAGSTQAAPGASTASASNGRIDHRGLYSRAWVSNTFTDPTRNLRCAYYANRAVVTCMRANDRKQVSVYSYGGRGFQVYDWPDPSYTPFTPVLRYGQRWSFAWGRLECLSAYGYMACRSSRGHGFQIGPRILRTW